MTRDEYRRLFGSEGKGNGRNNRLSQVRFKWLSLAYDLRQRGENREARAAIWKARNIATYPVLP